MTDPELVLLLKWIISFLTLSSLVALLLSRFASKSISETTLQNLQSRIATWWMIVAIFILSTFIGKIGTVVLFATISFFALREVASLIKTRRSDYSLLVFSFIVVLPMQYALVAMKWYGLFAIFIPVFVASILAIWKAWSGDNEGFFESIASVEWCLLLCIYFVSHAPALLMLDLSGSTSENFKLLWFFTLVVQINDVTQYIFGKLFGKTPLNKKVSPNKTIEGLAGGIVCSTLVGYLLSWLTPFAGLEAALMALICGLAGTGGGLVLSAIKRDAGVKDYGTILPGHGGMMDRFDSLCFAAPVFFHLTRYFFAG